MKLKQSISVLKQNALILLLCSLIDVGFFFVYGFLTSPIRQKIAMQAIELGSLLSGQGVPALSGLFTPQTSVFTEKIVFSLIIFAVLTYVLYCVFQGVNWKLALDITGRKTKWLSYLNNFARVNALWFVIFVLFYAINVFAAMRRAILSALGTAGFDVISLFSIIGMAVIAYFALLSYPSTSIKKAWATGKKLKSISIFLPIIVYFIALNFLLAFIGAKSPDIMYITGLILFFPALTWARVLIALEVK